MADLVAFTRDRAGRIGRVVCGVERSPAFLAGKPIPITRGDDSWIGQRTSIDDSAGGRYFGKTALKGIDVASADWTSGMSLPAGYELVADEDVVRPGRLRNPHNRAAGRCFVDRYVWHIHRPAIRWSVVELDLLAKSNGHPDFGRRREAGDGIRLLQLHNGEAVRPVDIPTVLCLGHDI